MKKSAPVLLLLLLAMASPASARKEAQPEAIATMPESILPTLMGLVARELNGIKRRAADPAAPAFAAGTLARRSPVKFSNPLTDPLLNQLDDFTSKFNGLVDVLLSPSGELQGLSRASSKPSGGRGNVAISSTPAQLAENVAEALNEAAAILLAGAGPGRRRAATIDGALMTLLGNLLGAAAAGELFLPADIAPFLCLLDATYSPTGTPAPTGVPTGVPTADYHGKKGKNFKGKKGQYTPTAETDFDLMSLIENINPAAITEECKVQFYGNLLLLLGKTLQAGFCPAACSGGGKGYSEKGKKGWADCSLCPAPAKVNKEGMSILAAGSAVISDAVAEAAEGFITVRFGQPLPLMRQAPTWAKGGKGKKGKKGKKGSPTTAPTTAPTPPPTTTGKGAPTTAPTRAPTMSYTMGAVVTVARNLYIAAYTEGIALTDLAPFLCLLDATVATPNPSPAPTPNPTPYHGKKGKKGKGEKMSFTEGDFLALVESIDHDAITVECQIQLVGAAINLGVQAVQAGFCPDACSGGAQQFKNRGMHPGLDCSLCPDLDDFGEGKHWKKEGKKKKKKKSKGKARLSAGAGISTNGASAGLIAVVTMGAAYLVVNTALGRHRTAKALATAPAGAIELVAVLDDQEATYDSTHPLLSLEPVVV